MGIGMEAHAKNAHVCFVGTHRVLPFDNPVEGRKQATGPQIVINQGQGQGMLDDFFKDRILLKERLKPILGFV